MTVDEPGKMLNVKFYSRAEHMPEERVDRQHNLN